MHKPVTTVLALLFLCACVAGVTYNDKGPITIGVTTPGSVFPGDYDVYTVTPDMVNYNLRVVATTVDDNIDLLVQEETDPDIDVPGYVSSVRESNPWGVDIPPTSLSTGDWKIAVRGDNRPPQQTGNSDYEIRASLEFNFLNFNLTTCPGGDPTCHIVVNGDTEWGVQDDLGNLVMRLTNSDDDQAGSAWWDTPIKLTDGFDTQFKFRLHSFTAESCDAELFCGGGDGFAFVVHNSATTTAAIGNGGKELGYGGITNALVVEFDTWNNRDLYDIKQGVVTKWIGATQYVDYNDNHVAVLASSGEGVGVSANHEDQIGGTPSINDLNDEEVHTARIKYFAPYLSIFIDDLRRPVLTVEYTLDHEVDDVTGLGYIGFTAATGSVGQVHDILSWTFCERIGCSV